MRRVRVGWAKLPGTAIVIALLRAILPTRLRREVPRGQRGIRAFMPVVECVRKLSKDGPSTSRPCESRDPYAVPHRSAAAYGSRLFGRDDRDGHSFTRSFAGYAPCRTIRLCAGALPTLLIGAMLAAGPARAETVEEFYRGKTITMYVGTGVGAGAVGAYPMALGPVMKKYLSLIHI